MAYFSHVTHKFLGLRGINIFFFESEKSTHNSPTFTMAEQIEKKVENLSLDAAASAPAAKPQGKPKEKKAKKPVAEGSYPLEV